MRQLATRRSFGLLGVLVVGACFGGVRWTPVYSPLLPTEWPPTPTTAWVRYGYAHGFDRRLADAVRVAQPWARVEIRDGGAFPVIVPLRTEIEGTDIQGVQPVADAAQREALERADEVLKYCLGLRSQPDPNARDTRDMRAFYRAWLAANGAIARVIAPRHADLVIWVEPY